MKEILTNLILVLFSIIFSILSIEAVLGLLSPDREEFHLSIKDCEENKIYNIFKGTSAIRYDLKPGCSLWWCEINRFGFRSEEPDSEKKQIIFLGDSVVFGNGLEEGNTLPQNLEKSLQDSDLQVLNLGVPGYNTQQYYLFLKEKLSFLNPSILIVGCTLNDDSPSLIIKLDNNDRKLYVISYPDIYRYFKINPEIDLWLLKYSKIYRKLNLFFAKYMNRNKQKKYLYNIYKNSQVEAFSLLKKEAESLNIPIFAVIFPMFDRNWNKYAYDAQHERLHDILKYIGIEYYDMKNDLEKYDVSKIRFDDIHFSKYGTKIAGALIAKQLKERGIIK